MAGKAMEYYVEQCDITNKWCLFKRGWNVAMLVYNVEGHATRMARRLNECHASNPSKLPKLDPDTWRFDWTAFHAHSKEV